MLRTSVIAMVIATSVALGGCSWFGHGKSGTKQVSVFDIRPGQCFTPPTAVKVQLSKITGTPCTKPHTQESYAVIRYSPAGSASGSSSGPVATQLTSSYPGADVLSTFAQGACAQQFQAYVGVDYLDSKLFFTYLLPSARSWEQQADRNVICFVTTTGSPLTSSVKGSKQ